MLPTINRKVAYKEPDNAKIQCCFCFQELQDAKKDLSVTKCNHQFCTGCLLKNIKYQNNCPLCRTILTSPNEKFKINHKNSALIVHQELAYLYHKPLHTPLKMENN